MSETLTDAQKRLNILLANKDRPDGIEDEPVLAMLWLAEPDCLYPEAEDWLHGEVRRYHNWIDRLEWERQEAETDVRHQRTLPPKRLRCPTPDESRSMIALRNKRFGGRVDSRL